MKVTMIGHSTVLIEIAGTRILTDPYFGTWGNDNSPGASTYTHAEIFNMDDAADAAEYQKRVKHWESQPEWEEVEADTE